MKERLLLKSKEQNGAIMVEAVFVFPIVLFILVLIIYLGNIYYQMARVDEVVNRYAIKGAQNAADPLLAKVEGGELGIETSSKELNLQPYRYVTGIFGKGYVEDIENKLSEDLKNELENTGLSLFSSVKIKNVTSENSKICKYNAGFFTSSFVVQVNYEISYPFYWLGGSKMSTIKASSRCETAVNDMDEFIRNIDMIVDLAEGTEFASKVSEWFSKMNGFIKKFGEWGN